MVFLWDLLISARLLVKSLLYHEVIDFLTRQLLEIKALKLLVLFVEQQQLRWCSSDVLELGIVAESSSRKLTRTWMAETHYLVPLANKTSLPI